MINKPYQFSTRRRRVRDRLALVGFFILLLLTQYLWVRAGGQ